MPLASCPVCEKKISKKARFCVGCGEPDPFYRGMISKVLQYILLIILVIGGGYAFWQYGVPMLIELLKNA